MRLALALLLAGCTVEPAPSADVLDFSDEGPEDAALPPPTRIAIDAPAFVTVGRPFSVDVSGALEGERVFVGVASEHVPGAGPCPRPLGGYCLDISRPVGFGGVGTIGGDGTEGIDRVAPPYAGAEHCFQAVIIRGPAGIDTAFSNVECVEFCADEDADGDGVCDAFDICIGADERDDDGDGICNDSDTCPGGPDGVDSDDDGVCDHLDTCPGGLDDADADGDGVCDLLDACPGFDDRLDEDGDGLPDGCDLIELCSEVASRHCEAKGWVVVGGPDDGNIVCTIDGRSTGNNCDLCGTYNIYVWEDGSEERHCPGSYSTVAGNAYSAHTPCVCGDNLDFCFSWDMEDCIPD